MSVRGDALRWAIYLKPVTKPFPLKDGASCLTGGTAKSSGAHL